jgi:hypothetical protein
VGKSRARSASVWARKPIRNTRLLPSLPSSSGSLRSKGRLAALGDPRAGRITESLAPSPTCPAPNAAPTRTLSHASTTTGACRPTLADKRARRLRVCLSVDQPPIPIVWSAAQQDLNASDTPISVGASYEPAGGVHDVGPGLFRVGGGGGRSVRRSKRGRFSRPIWYNLLYSRMHASNTRMTATAASRRCRPRSSPPTSRRP